MNYLIGDIGNTNTKICRINQNFKVTQTYLFETRNLYFEKNLNKKMKHVLKKNTNRKILFSSVVPKVYQKISFFFNKKNFKVFEIKKFNLKKIIRFNISKYSQLGSDRIANAIGVNNKFNSNCIVIDFGTATTFDIIKKNGVYDGGVIAPGIKSSMKNLYSSTALLPKFNLKKYPKNYGKDTKQALSTGFFWGYQGLINNIIKKIIKKNGDNFKIILTGGYSYLFKNHLFKISKVENDITMQGIIKIYKEFLL